MTACFVPLELKLLLMKTVTTNRSASNMVLITKPSGFQFSAIVGRLRHGRQTTKSSHLPVFACFFWDGLFGTGLRRCAMIPTRSQFYDPTRKYRTFGLDIMADRGHVWVMVTSNVL